MVTPSYLTHYYCSSHKWVPQEDARTINGGLYCPECSRKLRTRPHYSSHAGEHIKEMKERMRRRSMENE